MEVTVKHAIIGSLLVILIILLAPQAAPAEQTGKPKLPESYRKWLDEDVVYIISTVEREVFLKLQTDRERDLFIEAFWKQRDPTPGSDENEFKTEHFRRVAFANRYFGRDAPRPGWQTDRGRFYIILGEPNDIQRFGGSKRPTTPKSGSIRERPTLDFRLASTSFSSGKAATENIGATAQSTTGPKP